MYVIIGEMRIRITEDQDLTELSITFQKILAYLEDNGVSSVERCNIYLTPLKPSGSERELPATKLIDFEIMPDKPKTGGGAGRKRSYSKSR